MQNRQQPSGYWEIAPPDKLRTYIDAFWFYQPKLDRAVQDVLIPEGVVDIVFNFGAAYSRRNLKEEDAALEVIGQDVVVGQRSDLFEIEWPTRTQLFAIRVKPEYAHCLVEGSMARLTDATLPINNTPLMELGTLLHTFKFSQQDLILEACCNALLSFIARLEQSDPRLIAAIRLIRDGCEPVDLSRVSASVGTTQRTLERLFKQRIGLSPKRYERIIRVHKFLVDYSRQLEPNLTQSATQAWFYDQSHFIKEFRHFTGTTPAQFFKSPPEIYQPLITSLISRYIKPARL
jgi:AraC-like DNA-binding protein